MPTNALEQILATIGRSYTDLLISVPLVLAGILLTGTAYYLAFVRPHLEDRSLKGWLTYLFPPENYTSKSAKVDIAIWLINGLIFIPLFEASVLLAGLVIGVGFNDVLTNAFGPGPQATSAVWLLVVIQFFGFWFGQGFGQYVGHLAMHKVPFFWALHRAHHSAESANLFTFLRSHPLEHFVNGSTRVAGGAAGIGFALYLTGGQLLPATTLTLLWYGIIYVLIGFRSVDHLHIPVSYGRVLDVLIGSPIMHQVHHSAELKHRDVNMAGAGYIFDWMFGTLYIPERGETWRWGLNDDELGERNPHNTVRGFFFEPIAGMGAALRALGSRPSSGATARTESSPPAAP